MDELIRYYYYDYLFNFFLFSTLKTKEEKQRMNEWYNTETGQEGLIVTMGLMK